MAGEAVLVRRPCIVEHPSLLVRSVAIHTGRYLVRFLFPQSAFDNLNVDLFNPGMALGAGGGHLISGYAGSGVGVRQDIVGGVARGTHRRHAQAGPEEPISMDGHGVVLENPVLRNIPGEGYLGSLSVATTAEEGDVHLVRGGGGIAAVFDAMPGVTICTGGGQRVTSSGGLSVKGLSVKPSFLSMAESAFHRGHGGCRMGEGDVLVAKGASYPCLTMD